MRDGHDNPKQRMMMCVCGIGAPAAVAVIAMLPKSAAYGATSRFALTLATFAIGIAGFVGFSVLRRRRREQLRYARWGSASPAVRDTLSYLRHEERLARRGQLTAAVAASLAFSLYIVAHWPQATWLAPFRNTFGVAALLCLVFVPIAALRNRRHWVNWFFLKSYFRQQIQHLAYRGPTRRKRRRARSRAAAPAVTVDGEGSFTINGFRWTFDDYTQGALLFGQPGSGKTMILNSLLEGLIASSSKAVPIAGLILDAKGDFKDKIVKLCERYGRRDDLYILDPDQWAAAPASQRSIAWNLLQNQDDALEMAVRLVMALRLIGLDQGHESFWLDSAKVFLRHAICLVRGAALTEAPSIIDVHRLAQEGEAATPFYHALVRGISARHPGDVPGEILDALGFMEREWSPMPERQKAGVRGTLTQLLDEFNVAPFKDIFTRASTISIADIIDQGKILYVYMPAADRERMSRLVTALIKLEFQRHVLLRPRKVRASFMLVDEAQAYYSSGDGRGDSDFVERSRESRHANIFGSQNMSAFLKKTKNQHDVKNFLGNCAVKIFLRNTEEETNRWASALFGQRNEIVITTNEQAAFDGNWSRRHHTSYGRTTRSLPRVPPELFTTLAVPIRWDPAHQYTDSIIHLAARSNTREVRLAWPVNPLR